jgi:hypothetical protein
VAIPEWIEYSAISGLSREMRETLERVRPITIGQASRIPGVTPAALSLVHVSMQQERSRTEKQAVERFISNRNSNPKIMALLKSYLL